MNIGLFYGSSTCYTEMAAEKIRDIIGPELVTLHNLKDDAPANGAVRCSDSWHSHLGLW
jgi:flavodoxin II